MCRKQRRQQLTAKALTHSPVSYNEGSKRIAGLRSEQIADILSSSLSKLQSSITEKQNRNGQGKGGQKKRKEKRRRRRSKSHLGSNILNCVRYFLLRHLHMNCFVTGISTTT
jgi:hypothetical protein